MKQATTPPLHNLTLGASFALLLVAGAVVVGRGASEPAVLWVLRALFAATCALTLYGDWRAGYLTKSLKQLHRLGVKGSVQGAALLVGTWAMFLTT